MKTTLFCSFLTITSLAVSPLASAAPPQTDDALTAKAAGVSRLGSGASFMAVPGQGFRDHIERATAENDQRDTAIATGTTDRASRIASIIDVYELAGYTIYTLAANPLPVFRGRAGLLYESLTEEACSGRGCESEVGNTSAFSVGVGAAYNLGKHFNILGGYSLTASDISHLKIGLRYNFN
jgi:hypothetical protein